MSTSERKPWTRDELMLAINLYCKTPFGKIHVRNPDIIALATRLDRTPGSVSYKLANFASLDPSLDRKGAANVSRLDREVWNEFYENWDEMSYQSELMSNATREQNLSHEFTEIPAGKTRDMIVKQRVNQNFFRDMILASYNFKCCITGLPVKELLVASHIKPWAIDEPNRMNPRNGLCINALHDKAFDKGLITIASDLSLIVASHIRSRSDKALQLLNDIHGKPIEKPNRFLPDLDFLKFHRDVIFQG